MGSSSSIARSEEWYHRDDKAIYTTRYWPSIDSELARAHACRCEEVASNPPVKLAAVPKPAPVIW